MKKIYLVLLFCVLSVGGYAQTAASYSFSRSSGTYSSIVGGLGTISISSGGLISDDGVTTGVPIGFTFNFCGTNYTTLAANANGYLSLAGATISGNPDYVNQESSLPFISGGTGLLMPFWRNLYGVNKVAYYQTSGTAGSQVFTFEYVDWSRCCTPTDASLNFQVKLYEGTNRVEFRYSTSSGLVPTTATIGICNSTTDFQTLPLATSTSTNSSFNTSCSLPADGTILQFCPPAAAITGNAPVCEGSTIILSDAVTGGTWTSSDPSTAAVDGVTGVVTGVNAGNAVITYMTLCGATVTTVVTVNPVPDVLPIGNQAVCNGATTTAITFGTTVPGTTFDWTNSDPSIGLAATGTAVSGIPSFTVTNSSNVPVNAVITVTPVRMGCLGAAQTFTITVNPTPDVVPSSNQTLCNGDTTATIHFTGSVTGTVFNWTNTDPSIGLAGSGTGNIASFTATNSTTAPVTAVITVNTIANSCTGGSNSFTIVVNPTPVLSSLLNPPAICDNTIFSYTPTSLTSGTTITWFRDAVTGISNPAATGIGNPNEILLNITPNPVTVVYIDTLSANGCLNTQPVTVVVNPTPVLTSTLFPAAVCSGTGFTYVHTSLTSGTTFNWSRDFVPGITNPASTGADTIRETLINSTPNPVPVVYMDTLKANGCVNVQAINVTVNPKPVLTTPTSIAAICDSSSILYVPESATTGTTFFWSRPAITGIANAAANGADTIRETLYNNVAYPVLVTYYDTLKANGCVNVQAITVSVNPTPKLSSAIVAPSICDSTVFNYTPLSNTLGTTFNWVRPFVLGIGSPAGSGGGNPNEFMVNNTNDNLVVSYVYTLAANGCTHVQIVTDTVHPLPTLSSALTGKVCSGDNFHYQPMGYVFGTTYTWSRASVTNVTPATGTGSNNIDEVLTNGVLTPLTTYYKISLKANNCLNAQYLKVTVNPAPPVMPITTFPLSSLCSGTMFQNFGAASVPPAGQNYHWEATNAQVWATGDDKQYCLVSFQNPGTAVVTLKSNVDGISCTTNSSYTVNVGTSVSDTPKVVYFEGQFICLQNNEDSYQWGFDDGTTLDSTIIAGENNPNYFNSAPDLTHRYYWVITKRGDCMQKTYYNRPLGITEVGGVTASLKLYPNPASEILNVDISSSADGRSEERRVGKECRSRWSPYH